MRFMTVGELIAEPLRTGISRAGSPASREAGLTLSSVRNGRLDLGATKPIDLTFAEQAKYQVRPGAFYVVRGNGRLGLVGRGAIAPSSVSIQVAFPDLLIELVPNESLIDPQYLALAWNEALVRSQIEGLARTSSGIHKINLANLRSVRLPVESLDRQRRIASELAAQLDLKVLASQNLEDQLSKAQALRERVLEHAFEMSGSPYEQLGRTGLLQDGDWILNADYSTSGVRLFQVGDVGRGKLLARSNRYISRTRAEELGCTLLRSGDILISRMPDPIGRACLVPDLAYESITAVDVTIFRPNPRILDAEYAVQFMNSRPWLHAVSAKASGATRARISRLNLELLKVPVPDIDAQRRIAAENRDLLVAIGAIEASLLAEQEAIDALPAALLRRAFG
jgi:restriction endonuclease S subunit